MIKYYCYINTNQRKLFEKLIRDIPLSDSFFKNHLNEDLVIYFDQCNNFDGYDFFKDRFTYEDAYTFLKDYRNPFQLEFEFDK